MKHIPVILFGVGGVGRELLRQIIDTRDLVKSRNGCRFNVVSVLDSRSWIWQPAGLGDDQLLQIIYAKEAGQRIGGRRPDGLQVLAQSPEAGLERCLVVDVTAADGMEPVINKALEAGYGVVLANKKPLTGPWEETKHFFNHSSLRYESTVGGGQPVIATLRYLRDTGDHIFGIEGQLSGTLGYICGQLDLGIAFSQALANANALGFTEPDPREDLGGQDVKRKMMILGRMAGWPLEDEAIEVESLYHPSLSHLSVDEFMEAAVAMDPTIRDRVRVAHEEGKVLRYLASIDEQGGSVGLKGVQQGNPLADLKYISFCTSRYEDEPLMIGGKGAGVAMTAGGVLGDMIGLARERLNQYRS
jgi:homoserine dehydrogenase